MEDYLYCAHDGGILLVNISSEKEQHELMVYLAGLHHNIYNEFNA